VSQRLSLEARKTATAPMSSGWPLRPSGVSASMAALWSALRKSAVPSVSTQPGLMVLTRIRRAPQLDRQHAR